MNTHEETIANVAEFLQPAIALFQLGQPVTLSFCPGDGTKYALMFTPEPAVREFETYQSYPMLRPTEAVLTVIGPSQAAAIIDAHGDPVADYVRTTLKIDNRCTIAAVGVCWALMVGCDAAFVARAYGDDDSRGAIADWENYQ